MNSVRIVWSGPDWINQKNFILETINTCKYKDLNKEQPVIITVNVLLNMKDERKNIKISYHML